MQRAHVLAVDVDVDEAGEPAVGVDPLGQLRVAAGQVVERLADGLAGDGNFALTTGLRAQRGRDADGDTHRAAQNST